MTSEQLSSMGEIMDLEEALIKAGESMVDLLQTLEALRSDMGAMLNEDDVASDQWRAMVHVEAASGNLTNAHADVGLAVSTLHAVVLNMRKNLKGDTPDGDAD